MEKNQGILKPFLRVSAMIIGMWDRCTGKKSVNTTIAHDLRILYPQQELQQLHRDFRIKRLGMTLAVLCLGGICTLIVYLESVHNGPQTVASGIARGDYGDSDREVVLEVQYGEYTRQLDLVVGARIYSREMIQQLAEEFIDCLPDLILQENPSLEQIVGDLYLAESYEGYPFLVSWYSGNLEYLDRNGRIVRQVPHPMEVELNLIMSYEDMEWERTLQVTLLPSEIDKPVEEELLEYLEGSEQGSRSEAFWYLPEDWNGLPLEYRIVEGDAALVIGGLFALASVLIFFFARKDLHRQYLDRQQELKASYPDLLHQITLYLGAGMTIRGSLLKIYESYRNAQEAGLQPPLATFEEVGYVCRELATGVAESQAYESWGRRTGLPEYIQLCTLLVQNLQKGSTLLVERLREENANAQREYLRHCRRISEEAQTKLLVPLVLMLVVVMLLILIPAFSMAGM